MWPFLWSGLVCYHHRVAWLHLTATAWLGKLCLATAQPRVARAYLRNSLSIAHQFTLPLWSVYSIIVHVYLFSHLSDGTTTLYCVRHFSTLFTISTRQIHIQWAPAFGNLISVAKPSPDMKFTKCETQCLWQGRAGWAAGLPSPPSWHFKIVSFILRVMLLTFLSLVG